MRKRMAVAAYVGLTAMYLLLAGEPTEPRVADPARDELDALLAASGQRLALKETVYDGLIAGRLTLPEAVAECEDIEGRCPELAATFRRGFEVLVSGRTFRERLAWSVVRSCEVILRDRSVPDDATFTRLKGELQ